MSTTVGSVTLRDGRQRLLENPGYLYLRLPERELLWGFTVRTRTEFNRFPLVQSVLRTVYRENWRSSTVISTVTPVSHHLRYIGGPTTPRDRSSLECHSHLSWVKSKCPVILTHTHTQGNHQSKTTLHWFYPYDPFSPFDPLFLLPLSPFSEILHQTPPLHPFMYTLCKGFYLCFKFWFPPFLEVARIRSGLSGKGRSQTEDEADIGGGVDRGVTPSPLQRPRATE